MGHSRRLARVAVSGAGWWGQGWHLPHLQRRTDTTIAGIVERATAPRSSNAAQSLETTAQLSERYGCPVFENVEALLASPLDKLRRQGFNVDRFADELAFAAVQQQERMACVLQGAARGAVCAATAVSAAAVASTATVVDGDVSSIVGAVSIIAGAGSRRAAAFAAASALVRCRAASARS